MSHIIGAFKQTLKFFEDFPTLFEQNFGYYKRLHGLTSEFQKKIYLFNILPITPPERPRRLAQILRKLLVSL